MKIAITSGYRYSLHAIALLVLLEREGFNVSACLNVSMLNLERFQFYLRQVGLKSLFNKFRRRVLAVKKQDAPHPEMRYICEYMTANQIRHFDLKRTCQDFYCQYVNVPSLNCAKALSILEKIGVELVVYAGGGILRKAFIDIPKIGVLNAHGGPLPHFRGMNASEWALFYGIQPGVTVHFINIGIDTGPILFFQPSPVKALDTIFDVRGKMIVLGVESLLKGVNLIASGEYQLTPQKRKDGRQFFVMTPPLLDIVESRIAHHPLKPYHSHRFRFPTGAGQFKPKVNGYDTETI